MKNILHTVAERSRTRHALLIIVILVAAIAAGLLLLRDARPRSAGQPAAAAGAAAGEAGADEHRHEKRNGSKEHSAGHAGESAHAGEAGHGHEGEAAQGGHDGVVAFTDEQLRNAGVVIERSGPGDIASRAQLPGEIRFNEDRTAHVVPRVAGVVDSVHADLGQQVKKGQLLAVISSPALSEQRSELMAAQKRLALARTTAERERRLFEDRISAQQDFLQAEQVQREAEIAVANASQKLKALGAAPAGPASDLARYALRAPFDGLVVEKHIALGESVKEDANVFTVSDLATVWAQINVTASQLPLVRVGEPALVKATGFQREASGQVSYVGALLGEQTRAATARVTLPNPEMAWRPGLFVTVELTHGQARPAVTVAADAIQTVENRPTVYARVAGGFAPRAVKTGRSDGQRTEILEGLEAGTEYAGQGSFAVKAQQGKGSSGHEH